MPDAIPADVLIESAIPALIASDRETLRRLETLASRVTAPENGERYSRLCNVYRGLLEETARNLRLVRRATGREPVPVSVRRGIRSKEEPGGPQHGNPEYGL